MHAQSLFQIQTGTRQKSYVWSTVSVKGVLTCHTFTYDFLSAVRRGITLAKIVIFSRTTIQNKSVPQLLDWSSNCPVVHFIENIRSLVKWCYDVEQQHITLWYSILIIVDYQSPYEIVEQDMYVRIYLYNKMCKL